MSKAFLCGGAGGGSGFIPQRGVDYWTPEDVESIENIVREKSSMIGGFIPVKAPVWKDGTKIRGGLATITTIKEEDGATVITFNESEELIDDGDFEDYADGDSLVLLNSDGRNENGWTAMGVDGLHTRWVRIVTSPESHSGGKYVAVKCPYSSIWKSLKLKPHTSYVISYWVKGLTDLKHNLAIGGKMVDGNVYHETSSSDYRCDKGRYNSILLDVWYNSTVSPVEDGGWQRVVFPFRTLDEEYVDICIHFYQYGTELGLDDFSVLEDMGDVFIASYAAGESVPEVIKLGADFYIESYGDYFTRFEYASSSAITNLYRDLSHKIKMLLNAAGIAVDT